MQQHPSPGLDERYLQHHHRHHDPGSAAEELVGPAHGDQEEVDDHVHVFPGCFVSDATTNFIADKTNLRSVTIISIVRLQSLILFANSANISWDYTAAAYWSTLEIHVGIICACLPSCRHLLISLGASILRSTKFGNSAYANSKGYGSRSNPLQSGNGLSVGKGGEHIHAQEAPKRGDEGDFVPLVESPHHQAFEKGSTYNSNYSVSVSKASNADSV